MAKSRKKPDPAVVAQLQARLEADVRKQLAPLQKRCATKLAKLTAKPAPAGFDQLLFEISEYDVQFGVIVFAENQSPVGEELVALLRSVESPGFMPAQSTEYADAGIDTRAAVKLGILDMLANAWAQAGGSGYSLPAIVRYHDDEEYDLLKREWAA